MSTAPTHNILIISDLHLGEDLKPATKTGYLRHVAMLERELESFLSHYRNHRRDGRPWHLIVNGDMVDFLSVCVLPRAGQDEHDPEDLVYGLGSRPQAARRKMLRVLERHPGVFRALACFVAAGNKLSIVVGNHDVEFHWPIVQETFKRGIADRWREHPSSRRPGAPTPAELEARIEFYPWFYFQKDVVWVEHGHQYDDFCSFAYFLAPVDPEKEQILLSVGAAGARYVSNHIPGADPHQAEDWNFWGYMRLGFALGARGLVRIVKAYIAMTVSLLSVWRVFSRSRDGVERRRRSHRERLRQLAEQFALGEDTLIALDNLRREPVITNFARLAMAVMLDRVLVYAATAILVPTLVLALPWGWALTGVAAALALAYAVSAYLGRTRGHTDPHEKMKIVPQKIREKVRTPFVVFGHSHLPVALPLDGGGMYFNTGTWVATEKPGLLRSFTHVMIRHDEHGPQASLYQWRDGASCAYVPEAKAS